MIYVENVDKQFAKALAAGGEEWPVEEPILRRPLRHSRRPLRHHLDDRHPRRRRLRGRNAEAHGGDDAGARRLTPLVPRLRRDIVGNALRGIPGARREHAPSLPAGTAQRPFPTFVAWNGLFAPWGLGYHPGPFLACRLPHLLADFSWIKLSRNLVPSRHRRPSLRCSAVAILPVRCDLRAIMGDGVACSVMIGIGENYLAAVRPGARDGRAWSARCQRADSRRSGSSDDYAVGDSATRIESPLGCGVRRLPSGEFSAARPWPRPRPYSGGDPVFDRGRLLGRRHGLGTRLDDLVYTLIPRANLRRRTSVAERGYVKRRLSLASRGADYGSHYGESRSATLAPSRTLLVAAAMPLDFRYSAFASERCRRSITIAGRRRRQESVLATALAASERPVALYLWVMQAAAQVASPYFTPFMLGGLKFSYSKFMLVVSTSLVAKAVALPTLGVLAQRFGAMRLLRIARFYCHPAAAVLDDFAGRPRFCC